MIYNLERAMDAAEAELRHLESDPFTPDEALREVERELGEMQRDLDQLLQDQYQQY